MNVRFVINNINITIINDIEYTTNDNSDKIVKLLALIVIIERIVEIKQSKVAETIDTKVSPTTRFSISCLLSIFPTKIAANPNRTVKASEKMVVNTCASVSSIII